jgi:trans-2,3-dihydro-3-hydroxyanthranilate isomerase
MLAFARETRLSETTFVQAPAVAGADFRNRIWTMRGELPFAGHPSLGTAVAVALSRGEERAAYVQQTPAGLQPIDVEVTGPGAARASMLQEPATFHDELDPAEIARTLGLDVGDLDAGRPPRIVSTGARQVLVLAGREALARVRPDRERLDALLEGHGCVVAYLAAVDGPAARCRSFFVDPGGVTEDPATGSAAGPLLAWLHELDGTERLTVEQGVEMERPSRLECAVQGDRVRVAGEAVVVLTGTVEL